MSFRFTFDKSALNSKPVSLLSIFVIIYIISIIVRFFSVIGLLVFAGLTLYILYLADQQFDNAWGSRQDLLHRIERLEAIIGSGQNQDKEK